MLLRAAGQRWIRSLGDGVNHRPEIFHRRIELNMVRRPKDQAAILAQGVEPREYFIPNIHRIAKW
jgi:hypothetical protein